MTKLLGVKDRVLLGLAFLGDVFDEARLLGGMVSANYQNLYGWVPPQYKRNNLYKAVSELFETGDIEKRVENGKVCLVLTNRGGRIVVRKFPLVKFARVKWDGIFTQVVFDIKEIDRKVRDAFRRKLSSLGFGRLQKSVYIIPHNIAQDIAEFVEAYHLADVVKVFRSKLAMGDPKELAEKVWKVSRLNGKYRRSVEDWEEGKGLTGKKREELICKLKSRFLEIAVVDPFLPRELLPDDWVGEKARRLIEIMK